MKVFVILAFLAAVVYAEPPSFRQQQQNRYFFARQQEETTASGPYAPSGWKPDGPAFNLPQRQQKQQQVENAYGVSLQPQQQYGAPQAPQQQGPPQPPQQQYGAPAAVRAPITRQNLPTLRIQAFARQQQQQPQYGAPQEAQQQQQQYGAPQEPQQQQQQYGAPLEPQQQQQQYGAPLEPQQQYGASQQAQQQYGASQQNPAPEFPTTEFPSVTEVDEPTTDSGLSESEPEQVNSTNEFEDDADLDGQSQKSQQQQDRGEYYVALPDGRLQRVRYVSRQDLEAMRYFAKIRAENVEPLRGPIYAYAPLQKLQVAPGNLQVAVSAAPAVPTVSITAPEERPQKLVQSPKVDIKPLAQVQIQHDTPAQVVPLSSSYTTYTANYQVPEDRYILAFP